MRAKRLIMPALIAFLSLGFFSQSPLQPASVRRISSFECVDCMKDPVSAVPVPSLMPFMVDANNRQALGSFNLFSRQLDFQTSVNNLSLINGFNRMFARLPTYPSYVLPSVADYQAKLVTSAPGPQIFSGLNADPALKFLIQPGIDARTNPSVATGIAPTPINVAAILDANLGLAPSPNVAPVTAPAPAKNPADDAKKASDALLAAAAANVATAAAAVNPGGETIVPKTQDRLTQGPAVSSLRGSRPVTEPIAPQITFQRSK